MYKLSLMGEKQNIFVSYANGEKIKKVFEDEKIPDNTKIVTNEWSGLKGSIKSIYQDKEGEGRAISSDFDFEAKNKEWLQWRAQEQAKNPEIRAKDMAWFNLIKQSVVGDRPASQETLEKAEKIQEKFFRENPYNTVCDPTLFKSLFPVKSAPDHILSGVIISTVMKDNQYAFNKN